MDRDAHQSILQSRNRARSTRPTRATWRRDLPRHSEDLRRAGGGASQRYAGRRIAQQGAWVHPFVGFHPISSAIIPKSKLERTVRPHLWKILTPSEYSTSDFPTLLSEIWTLSCLLYM